MLPALPEQHFQQDRCGSCGAGEMGIKKPSADVATLSTQSLAARHRRRKITEKTLELGKLVPGGRKMNTAEMLQAAYKYVKYLQAQVGILERNQSIQKNEQTWRSNRELRVLLESPKIQEKLYAEEKCLVTNELVRAVAKDPEVTTDSISKEMVQLMCTHDWYI
ncbi:BHLH domain-containing protein, partial [Psidium guajava]